MVMPNLLFQMLLHGNFAEQLLSDAAKQAGLDLWAAQVCWLLGVRRKQHPMAPWMTPSDLRSSLSCPKSTCSTQLKSLCAAGLVAKFHEPSTDGRSIRYCITETGLRKARIFQELATEADGLFFPLLSERGEDGIDELARLIGRLNALGASSSVFSLEKALLVEKSITPGRRKFRIQPLVKHVHPEPSNPDEAPLRPISS